jgi:predicted RNase H-like HicB family nuclease
MSKLTLDYWEDDGGCVGRLREIPGVISQGDTLAELRENIVDACKLMISDAPKIRRRVKSTQVLVSA